MPEARRLAGYKYNALEQAEKEIALKAAKDLFPDLPMAWREWAYDYVVKEVGQEEFERRILSGYYETKSD